MLESSTGAQFHRINELLVISGSTILSRLAIVGSRQIRAG